MYDGLSPEEILLKHEELCDQLSRILTDAGIAVVDKTFVADMSDVVAAKAALDAAGWANEFIPVGP